MRQSRQARWFFTKDEILNTPSRRDGIDQFEELSTRHKAANLIQVQLVNRQKKIKFAACFDRLTKIINKIFNRNILGMKSDLNYEIKDCGKKLNVPQLTINTAIVFMHRFFMLHSMKVVFFKKHDDEITLTVKRCFKFTILEI